MVDDLVTVDQQKRSLRTITRLKKRVSTAKLVGLCVVSDRNVAVGRSEIRTNSVGLIPHDEMNVVDTRIDQGVEDVFENGRVPAGNIGLGRFAVSGRSRMPSPAANTTAELGRVSDEDGVSDI